MTNKRRKQNRGAKRNSDNNKIADKCILGSSAVSSLKDGVTGVVVDVSSRSNTNTSNLEREA